MSELKILLLPGDGIGPEISRQAEKVINRVSRVYDLNPVIRYADIGGIAIDRYGDPLPPETRDAALNSDAVLLAAVGGPKWDSTDPSRPRPEDGLLGLRKLLDVFANLRPVQVFDELIDSSPLKPEIVSGTDLLIVRELTSGIYFGDKKREADSALDTCFYSLHQVERTVKLAFEIARSRRKKVTLVDKANVLETSRFWREIFYKVARSYADVQTEVLLVDNAAMQLIRRPTSFDVIVTENMFGDILSDEAATISGSIGLLASASIGEKPPFLYEPIHGSAPDIAGKNLANPLAMILSVAMMFEYSFARPDIAAEIREAVRQVISEGYRTADLVPAGTKAPILGTEEMGDLIVEKIRGR